MTTPDRITEILEEMDRNPELASALQARILGSEIPQAVSQNQEQVLKIMEMQLKLASAMRENFGAVAGPLITFPAWSATPSPPWQNGMDRLGNACRPADGPAETRIDQLETRVDQRMDRLENGISDMKGFYTEQKTAQQTEIITSDLNLQWVRILTPGELNRLALGEAGGQALTDELRSFREADLVIEARDEEGNTQYLAAEVSFTGAIRDTERALRNAELLTRITGHPGQGRRRQRHERPRSPEGNRRQGYPLATTQQADPTPDLIRPDLRPAGEGFPGEATPAGQHCVVHLFFPGAEERLWITGIYFALSAWLVIRDWRRVKFLLREEPEEERLSRSG